MKMQEIAKSEWEKIQKEIRVRVEAMLALRLLPIHTVMQAATFLLSLPSSQCFCIEFSLIYQQLL